MNRSSSGYSLVELLVVIAIMAAVVIAAPIPGAGLLDRARLGFAARSVSAAIHAAEIRSETEGRPVTIAVAALGLSLSNRVRLKVTIGRSDLSELVFYPDQSASPATITITGQKRLVVLNLDQLTGRLDGAP